MKIKPVTYMVLACAFAMAACTPVSESYWQPVDQNSTASLTRAQTDALLNKNLAACNAGIADLDQKNVSDSDFDDCMQGQGWKRQGIAPPNPQWLKAAGDEHQYTPPVAQQVTGQVDGDKQQIAEDVKHNDLVPMGGRAFVGVVGYQARYRMSNDYYGSPAGSINTHTNYYGGTAGYTYRTNQHNFFSIDGYLARGLQSFNASYGAVDNMPSYEGEVRLTAGRDYDMHENGWVSPYLGLGGRLLRQDGDNYYTSLGVPLFDIRSLQLYAPIGATWHMLLPGSITMANTLEFDPLLLGDVDLRYQNSGAGADSQVKQKIFQGFGIRGEAMFGVPVADMTIEAGPFARYWNINDSAINALSCSGNTCYGPYEHFNTDLQFGLSTRVSF